MSKIHVNTMKFIFLVLIISGSVFGEKAASLGCSRHVHIARVEQEDAEGRRCWDFVTLSSCGGMCDSREIPDWEFPYKRSHHPVCAYAARRPVSVRLRHCDKAVAMDTDIFNYIAADECRCSKCSSENTSCEWLPPNSTLLDNLGDPHYDKHL